MTNPNLKKILLSNGGFTLVESLIAGAIGLVLLGGLMTSMATMADVQKSATISQDALMVDEEISAKFKMGDQCTQSLTGKIFPSAGAVVPVSFTTMIAGESVNLAEGAEVSPGLTISQLKLVGPAITGGATTVVIPAVTGPNYVQSTGSLRIEATKTVNGVATTLPKRDLPIRVLTDSSGKILACNMGASVARACAESGGKWDQNAVPPVCKPKDHCDFAGSFSDAPISQGGYVNEVTGALNCPTGYDKIRSGSMAYTQACNNKSICNTFYATYSCVKCGNALVADNAAISASGNTNDIISGDVAYGEATVTGTTTQVEQAGAAVNPPPTPTPAPTPTPYPSATATPAKTPINGGGGGGCFISGSQILMWNGQTKSIEDVEVGDQIVSIDEDSMKPYVSTVTRTLHHPPAAQHLYEVYLADGNTFVANGVHPIWVQESKGYLRMREIDEAVHQGKSISLYTRNKTHSRIIAIKTYDAMVPVFNIHVDGLNNNGHYLDEGSGHNFIVDGILAHNTLSAAKN